MYPRCLSNLFGLELKNGALDEIDRIRSFVIYWKHIANGCALDKRIASAFAFNLALPHSSLKYRPILPSMLRQSKSVHSAKDLRSEKCP